MGDSLKTSTRIAAVVTCIVALAGCRDPVESGKARPATETAPAKAPFCVASEELLKTLGAIGSAPQAGRHVGDVYVELDAFLRRAADTAPAGIRADVITVANAFSQFHQSLAGVGFDHTRLPSEAWAMIQSHEFAVAAGRVADHSRRTCHG